MLIYGNAVVPVTYIECEDVNVTAGAPVYLEHLIETTLVNKVLLQLDLRLTQLFRIHDYFIYFVTQWVNARHSAKRFEFYID